MQITVAKLVFDAASAGEPGAPMVLLLHGFPQSSYSWRYQLAPLAEAGFFALAPDQRGYSPGARPAGVEAYATEHLLGDALALMDRFGNGRAHVVGHDWGGQLAWLLAAHHAERVASLTVLSRPHPEAFAAALREDPAQAERSGHHRAFQDAGAARMLLADDARRLRELFGGARVPAAAQEAYLEVLGEEVALDSAINWYRASRLAGATPAVSVPTLYLWGNDDATVGRQAAERTADHVTGAYRFVELDGVGHFVTDEVGERVTRELLEHLAC